MWIGKVDYKMIVKWNTLMCLYIFYLFLGVHFGILMHFKYGIYIGTLFKTWIFVFKSVIIIIIYSFGAIFEI